MVMVMKKKLTKKGNSHKWDRFSRSLGTLTSREYNCNDNFVFFYIRTRDLIFESFEGFFKHLIVF